MELVVARHLLGQRSAVVLKDDEIPHKSKEAGLLEHALDQNLKFRVESWRKLLTGDGAPRLEPLFPRGKRTDKCAQAIRDHERGVAGKERGQLRLVGLQLTVGRPDRRGFVQRILQFDDRERKSIDEDDDVRAPSVLVFFDRELTGDEPEIRFGIVEVHNAHLGAPYTAVLVLVLDTHSVHQHAVETAVAIFQRRTGGAHQLALRIAESFIRDRRVKPRERTAQPRVQHDVRIALPDPDGIGHQVRATHHLVSERPKPVERRVFDNGFGDDGHRSGPSRTTTNSATVRAFRQ